MDLIGPDGLNGCHPALELVEFKSGFSISIKCLLTFVFFIFRLFFVILLAYLYNSVKYTRRSCHILTKFYM